MSVGRVMFFFFGLTSQEEGFQTSHQESIPGGRDGRERPYRQAISSWFFFFFFGSLARRKDFKPSTRDRSLVEGMAGDGLNNDVFSGKK